MNTTYINNQKYYLAIFDSKNHAIRLYYSLQKKGIKKYNLVSAPCQLKQGCNYSIKFENLNDYKTIQNLLPNNNIGVELYKVIRKNGKKEITKIDAPI